MTNIYLRHTLSFQFGSCPICQHEGDDLYCNHPPGVLAQPSLKSVVVSLESWLDGKDLPQTHVHTFLCVFYITAPVWREPCEQTRQLEVISCDDSLIKRCMV